MLNAIIVVSVALFGVSAGAVLGGRLRAGRRFPAIPGIADIAVLALLLVSAYAMHVRVWGFWFHFIEWVGFCMACGLMAQWLKPKPRLTHGLTQ